MTHQLTLQLDGSIAEHFRSVREVVAAGIYQRGLKRMAAELDTAPGNLSAALAGDGRHLSTDQLESYVAATGDTAPVLYLVARFLGATPEQIDAARQAKAQELLAEAVALLQAGQGVTTTRRGRG